ncbi:MAG: hypothetical protein ACP5PM_05760 [Acidimicrobiales bacterium]
MLDVAARRLMWFALFALALLAAIPLAALVGLGVVVLGGVALVAGVLVAVVPLALAPLTVGLANAVLIAAAFVAAPRLARRSGSGAGTRPSVTGAVAELETFDVPVPRLQPVHCPFADSNPCPGDCRVCVKYRLFPGSPGRLVA